LPGVGPKTSACTLVYGFKKPAICVDAHVHRISNRIGLVNTKTPEETEAELTKVVPKKYWLKLNHAMVRFGQKICLPRNPLHEECTLKKQCDFFKGRGRWKK
jgi:endonuclease-3